MSWGVSGFCTDAAGVSRNSRFTDMGMVRTGPRSKNVFGSVLNSTMPWICEPSYAVGEITGTAVTGSGGSHVGGPHEDGQRSDGSERRGSSRP